MGKTRPAYPPEFRRQMVELVRAGRSPEELAREFEPTAQSIRNWLAQCERNAGSRNINRFYIVDVMPTSFGDWTVLREWGRRGSPGTMRLSSYERRNDARDRRAAHDQAPAAARLSRARREKLITPYAGDAPCPDR
jgi:predicted DNA-binding WGR domain protein